MVFAALRVAVLRIAAIDADARRGEPAGIHRLRTTIRRLRSELRSLADFVDARWHDEADAELKWLAGRLGEIRDLDILQARLKNGADLPDQGSATPGALAPLFVTLQNRRAQAARSLNDALRSDRYRTLLARLEQAARRPELSESASEQCGTVLPVVAAASWRRLKKEGRGLRSSDHDEAFHELRKHAKRTRYTSELIAPIMGRRAARESASFICLLTKIQDTLGEHHDAVVAAADIEDILASHAHDPQFVRAASRLAEAERVKANVARQAFFKIWSKLDRKKSRRWMKIVPKVNARA
jgi:CHAD domain-containing protein